MFDSRYRIQKERKAAKPTLQSMVRHIHMKSGAISWFEKFWFTHFVITSKCRFQVYNCLERPAGWKCFLYHFRLLFPFLSQYRFSVFIVVLVCLILSVLSTVEDHSQYAGELLYILVSLSSLFYTQYFPGSHISFLFCYWVLCTIMGGWMSQ